MFCALRASFLLWCSFFFFTDTAPPEIYTLSLHDALPICRQRDGAQASPARRLSLLGGQVRGSQHHVVEVQDRKSTRLNSSHTVISYAVFCLKKKKKTKIKATREHIVMMLIMSKRTAVTVT